MKVEKHIGLKEQIYIIEVVRGIYVTGTHFFRNIVVHIGHIFGTAKNNRGGVTYQYPEEVRPDAPRLRMRHRLMKRPDASPRCVACYMCETICPAECIHITASESPDPIIEKYLVLFDIDLSRCIYYGYCVEAYPCDAIRMDIYENKITADDRNNLVFTIKELLV